MRLLTRAKSCLPAVEGAGVVGAHGAIELVPGDLGKNETARPIHYMFDTLTAGPEGNAGGKTK
jgi:hypothetical protein